MATGIRKQEALQRIAQAMHTLAQQWQALYPKERVESIAQAVLKELKNIDVPLPDLVVNDATDVDGRFQFSSWTLEVSRSKTIGKLNQNPVPVIAELGDAIVHEARHCEQWYRMALYWAGQRMQKGIKVTAGDVQQYLSIDCLRVCAVVPGKANLLAGALLQEAQDWYGSVYGNNASFRTNLLNMTNLKPTGRQEGFQWAQTQYARYQRGLSEEDDAWSTGLELQKIFLHNTGINPNPLVSHPPRQKGVSQY